MNTTNIITNNNKNNNINFYANNSSRAFTEKVRYKRKTLQMMSRPLKRWLQENSKNPYPSRAVKQTLAKRSQMTLTQVSNWFANMRRRLKNTVPCRDGSWSTRITKYNDFVEGNAERFSDWSDGDSCDLDDTDTVSPLNILSLWYIFINIFTYICITASLTNEKLCVGSFQVDDTE
ncbi:homeobox protein Mohawk [Octopus sinensis]|uniref:Homeobox protein Mohawk n=1 Tax=Octopus sinensis TaxID=2607531 RepID=A0A6P7TQ32_9MOLL|nr:homeobox protein Mohawk [Octopus sinensis]